MENVWWIILVILAFGGGIGGFIRTEIEQRRQRKRELTTGPEPVCGCTHHYSFHDPKTGLCMHTGRTETRWDEFGTPYKWENKQCGCQRYIGPEPLASLYMPEISPGFVKRETED